MRCFTLILLLLLIGPVVFSSKPPLFELKDINGNRYSLKNDLGKSLILLYFWSNCCGSSLKQLPFIEKIYQKYKGKGLKAYAINVEDSSKASNIKPSVLRYGFEIPVLLDPENEVFRKFSPLKIKPCIFVIDGKGDVIGEFSGYKPGDEDLVKDLIEKELGRVE